MPDVKWYAAGKIFTSTITPSASGGSDLGTIALPWGSLYLAAAKEINWANDTRIERTSAGILSQRGVANAVQEFRVYGSSTAFLAMSDDGTGNSEFRRNGTGTIYFTPLSALGTGSWRMSGNTAGFEPYGDNLQDIGISGSSRVRAFYGGTKIELLGTTFAPSTTTVTTMVDIAGTFAPTAAGPTFAAVHYNPTLNGVSTGTAYALAVYPRTNVMAGGRLRIAGFGTSAGTFASGTEGVVISTGYAVAGTMTTVDPTTNEFPVAAGLATGYAVYAKSNKFVIAYYNAGNQLRYKTIPLDGATTSWTDSATAP